MTRGRTTCPRCNYDLRGSGYQSCPECGWRPTAPPMNDDDTVVLVNVQTEWEASFIAEALSERDINAQASGGLTAGFRAEAPGLARIIVPRGQVERAKQQLAEIRKEAASIDWSQIDVGEPE